jgi:hypothetical protein
MMTKKWVQVPLVHAKEAPTAKPESPSIPKQAPHWFNASTGSPQQRKNVYLDLHPCGYPLLNEKELTQHVTTTCAQCALVEKVADLGYRCAKLDRTTAWQASKLNLRWPACQEFVPMDGDDE